jgi:hypothetical protein
MSLLCASFVTLLGVVGFASRQGERIGIRMVVFHAFALLGTLLLALSFYWQAFGSPSGQPTLPLVAAFFGLGAFVIGFIVTWRPLLAGIRRRISSSE